MKKVTLEIDGMMCGMCEAHVNNAVRLAAPSAKHVKSSHKKNVTTFICDNDDEINMAIEAISKDGYRVLNKSVLEK